jgi:peroxiredoxin
MKRTLALLAYLALVSAAFAAAEVGKPAPEFTATDINGNVVKLSDYRGKVVVLESYNLDCPFCHNHYRSGAMQELQQELAKKDVVWLLVNSVNPNNTSHRSPEQARKEESAEKMTITAWIDDSSGTVGKAYGMRTTPHMFVVDQKGVLVYDGAIDNRPSPSGDPRTAKNYVRAAVDEVLAGQPVKISETKPYGCSVKYGG